MHYQTDNLRISGMEELAPPSDLIEKLPISEASSKLVFESRNEISEILSQKNGRLIVVVGPCSIHDPEAALDYANKLLEEIKKYKNEL